MNTPLELGVLELGDTSGANAAFGFSGQGGSLRQGAKAVVSYYNSHGGIAGRHIKIVEYEVPFSSNYETEFEAACARFTQDNHVEAIVSLAGDYYSDSYESCVTKARVPHVEGIVGADDRSYASYPGMVTVSGATINRRITSVLSGLSQSRYLSSKNTLGVVVEDCASNERAYAATFQPLARRLGLSVVRHDVDCLQGFEGVSQFESQTAAAVLKFTTAHVDRVTFISNFEVLALLGFSQAAEQQGYRPGYALSSLAYTAVGATAGYYPAGQLPQMTGVGWSPIGDVSGSATPSAATTRCRAIMTSEGVSWTDANSGYLTGACDAFFLLEAGLQRSQGNAAALVSAWQALGTSYLSPATIQGATRYDSTHRDGLRLFSVFAYRATCGCFVYTTKPAPLA